MQVLRHSHSTTSGSSLIATFSSGIPTGSTTLLGETLSRQLPASSKAFLEEAGEEIGSRSSGAREAATGAIGASNIEARIGPAHATAVGRVLCKVAHTVPMLRDTADVATPPTSAISEIGKSLRMPRASTADATTAAAATEALDRVAKSFPWVRAILTARAATGAGSPRRLARCPASVSTTSRAGARGNRSAVIWSAERNAAGGRPISKSMSRTWRQEMATRRIWAVRKMAAKARISTLRHGDLAGKAWYIFTNAAWHASNMPGVSMLKRSRASRITAAAHWRTCDAKSVAYLLARTMLWGAFRASRGIPTRVPR